MHSDTHTRTIVKTISWRVIATIVMFCITFFFTDRFSVSLDVAFTVAVFSTIAYYFHERAWNFVSWGKRTESEQ